jgi:hypothetical protein
VGGWQAHGRDILEKDREHPSVLEQRDYSTLLSATGRPWLAQVQGKLKK